MASHDEDIQDTALYDRQWCERLLMCSEDPSLNERALAGLDEQLRRWDARRHLRAAWKERNPGTTCPLDDPDI